MWKPFEVVASVVARQGLRQWGLVRVPLAVLGRAFVAQRPLRLLEQLGFHTTDLRDSRRTMLLRL